MSADQRDGTHGQAQTGVKTEDLCAEAADQVLDAAHHDRDDQELNDADAALLQLLKCSHISDGAEESSHEHALQGGIKLELQHTCASEDHVDDSEDQSADNRSRDTVTSEKCDFGNHHSSEQQHQHCYSNRLIHVQFNCLHNKNPPF